MGVPKATAQTRGAMKNFHIEESEQTKMITK